MDGIIEKVSDSVPPVRAVLICRPGCAPKIEYRYFARFMTQKRNLGL